MNKGLYTVSLLKDAAFNWVDPKLHEFLDKMVKKRNKDKESIFGNYGKFKEKLRRAFGVVNEKQAVERCIHILRQDGSAAKYSTEFQQIATLTEWDDEALTSQYYWGLKDTIKNEIVRMNRPEDLQGMIDAFINIDSRQWEQQMKHTEYQSHWMWTAPQGNQY